MKKANYILLVLVSLLAALLLTVALDRLAGLILGPAGLIYPPGSVAHYQTFEYRFTAQINSSGFRDREFLSGDHGRCRLVVLGDSFTYGWGVDLSQCWVKVLERNLRERGLAVEVANLGKPGADPAYYASLAARAIPALRPRLVVVAVLQGDDLISLRYAKPLTSPWSTLVQLLYPHTLKRPPGAYQVISQETTRQEYQKEAADIVRGLQGEAKTRFAGLDEFVRQVFMQGELNPAAIHIALQHPDYFLEPLRLDRPDISRLVEVMSEHFGFISRLARDYGAAVLILSIPNDIYVSPLNLRNREKMGYRINEKMLTTEAPDQAVRQAAGAVGLPVVAVTEQFRAKAVHLPLFFPYDGHFTPNGHYLFAEAVTPAVEGFLRQLQGEAGKQPMIRLKTNP